MTWLLLAAWLITTALLVIALAGDADLAERLRKSKAREAFLLDELDAAIEDAGKAHEKTAWWREHYNRLSASNFHLRERNRQLEREALPKAPNWGAAPAEWRVVS